MNEDVPGGAKRIETVAERLTDRMVDDEGRPADGHEVSEVVEATARTFADAPVQDFVPLLVENQAADELRARGLRADLSADRDAAPAEDEEQQHEEEPDRRSGGSAADAPLPPR